MNKFIYSLIVVLSLTILLSACNKPIFEPHFKVSKDSVNSVIHKLVNVEGINIGGYKTPVDDSVNTSLSIQLINPKQLPNDNDSLLEIQKRVASTVKSLLENVSQYKKYNIIFIQKESTKKNGWTFTKTEGLFQHSFDAKDLVIPAYRQDSELIDLAQRIFSKDTLMNIKKYITDGYEGPAGKDLQKGSTTKFLLLEQTEKKSVVAMTILDQTGKGADTYLYFEKDSTWKLSAFRALAMTGIIEGAKAELEKMTPQQVEEHIAKSKTMEKGQSLFSSREEYNYQLGNLKLILELDDNIAKHFVANQAAFERLRDLALKQLGNEKADEERSLKLIENYKADYQKLFISSVSTGGYELGNCINFLIGGMVDNSVGYLYVKNKKDLPEIDSDRIIMIREIGNGWYMYKTT